MESDIIKVVTNIFISFLTSLPQIIIVILCLYYLYKVTSKTEGILLAAGSIISLLCSVSIFMASSYISHFEQINSYETLVYISHGLSFFGSILFTIGFFLLIRKTIKNKSLLSKN